jgi:hypothetical protein
MKDNSKVDNLSLFEKHPNLKVPQSSQWSSSLLSFPWLAALEVIAARRDLIIHLHNPPSQSPMLYSVIWRSTMELVVQFIHPELQSLSLGQLSETARLHRQADVAFLW